MGFNINRFISNVDQNLLCNICTGVLEKAVVTLCGHTFCQQCLSTWLEKPNTDSCPACRAYTSKFDMIPNLAIRNMVDSLLVWCDNADKGCKIVMKLESVSKHLQRCDFREMECSACGILLPKIELPDHYRSCPALENEFNNSDQPTTQVEISIEILSRKIAALEIDLNKTREALRTSQKHASEVEKELQNLKQEHEAQESITRRPCSEWDPDYGYGYSPSSIAQLSCLISRYLLQKPSNVDRNRIFMAVKRCYTYYHSYAGYSQDVLMLLATSCASNWFLEHQRWTLERWLEQMTVSRFSERNTTSSMEYEVR